MTSGFFSGNLLKGLAFRVLFFLSLALLPIGILAISQTQQLAKQNRHNAELALIAMTEQASTTERNALQKAFNAGAALGSTIPLFWSDDAACSQFLRAYQDTNPEYALVGYIQKNGMMRCSSASSSFDFSDDQSFKAAVETPGLRARSTEIGITTGQPVTAITVPVSAENDLMGFINLSIPSDSFAVAEDLDNMHGPLALMTFNIDGDIISTQRGMDVSGIEAPSNVALSLFVGRESAVFEADNQEGAERIYVVDQIVPRAVYAISVWPKNTPLMNPSFATRLGTQLPIVMWLASLIVAFWALNRLAIRHIRKLSRQMRRFALNRALPRTPLGSSVPAELVEMESAFVGMGESILRDEATLEDSLREKNILLKEVHHRVKNNLQLISSIMNMQIRQAKSEDASQVLKRLQERILSLATVHKNLYQQENLVRVDASLLLREVVNQILAVGLAPGSNVVVTQNYTPISLEADDAAPLTLLISEAITNALKHVDQENGSDASISITLENQQPNFALLTLSNTTGSAPDQEGTGLGARLISAFARQLNGQVETHETDDRFTFTLSFPVTEDTKQIVDY